MLGVEEGKTERGRKIKKMEIMVKCVKAAWGKRMAQGWRKWKEVWWREKVVEREREVAVKVMELVSRRMISGRLWKAWRKWSIESNRETLKFFRGIANDPVGVMKGKVDEENRKVRGGYERRMRVNTGRRILGRWIKGKIVDGWRRWKEVVVEERRKEEVRKREEEEGRRRNIKMEMIARALGRCGRRKEGGKKRFAFEWWRYTTGRLGRKKDVQDMGREMGGKAFRRGIMRVIVRMEGDELKKSWGKWRGMVTKDRERERGRKQLWRIIVGSTTVGKRRAWAKWTDNVGMERRREGLLRMVVGRGMRGALGRGGRGWTRAVRFLHTSEERERWEIERRRLRLKGLLVSTMRGGKSKAFGTWKVAVESEIAEEGRERTRRERRRMAGAGICRVLGRWQSGAVGKGWGMWTELVKEGRRRENERARAVRFVVGSWGRRELGRGFGMWKERCWRGRREEWGEERKERCMKGILLGKIKLELKRVWGKWGFIVKKTKAAGLLKRAFRRWEMREAARSLGKWRSAVGAKAVEEERLKARERAGMRMGVVLIRLVKRLGFR